MRSILLNVVIVAALVLAAHDIYRSMTGFVQAREHAAFTQGVSYACQLDFDHRNVACEAR